jgi:hypothetical protein
MRAILLLSVFAAVASLPAHAADDQARSGTWTPPAYGAVTIKSQLAKSPFAEGFAAKKPGPGTRLLTAAAVMALQNTSFAHVDVVDQSNVMGYGPSGNPGRSGDRSFVGDKSMDKGIR